MGFSPLGCQATRFQVADRRRLIGIIACVTGPCFGNLDSLLEIESMSEKLHAVIETFPQFEELVRELSGTNPEFETLCHRYSEATEELHSLEQAADAERDSRAGELERRRKALADELHALMSANMRA